MLSSRCYLGSSGNLSCISCHDPHRTPAAEEKVEFYRAKCASCHEGSAGKACAVAPEERKKTSADDSCIVCHMPQLGGPKIAHNVQTDHRVVRKPGAATSEPAPDTPKDPREKYGRLFIDGKSDVPAEEVERAWAVFLGDLAFARKDSEAATLAVQTAKKLTDGDLNDRVLATSLGKAYEVLNDHESARNVWRDALEVWDKDEYLLEQLALSFQKANREEDSGQYFMRLAEENPFRAIYLEGEAHAQARYMSTRQAVDTATQALKLDPSLVRINLWLGEVYSVMGRNELAAENRRQAFKVKAAREALAPAGTKQDSPSADAPSSANR
jgi:Flp pilus assembly protein TadD